MVSFTRIYTERWVCTKNGLMLLEARGPCMFSYAPPVSRVDLPGHDCPKASSHIIFSETHSDPEGWEMRWQPQFKPRKLVDIKNDQSKGSLETMRSGKGKGTMNHE